MSIASASDQERKRDIWKQLGRDLRALGIPREAWPRVPLRRMFTTGNMDYQVHLAGGPPIDVFFTKQAYHFRRGTSWRHEYIYWNGDPAAAWLEAKRQLGLT